MSTTYYVLNEVLFENLEQWCKKAGIQLEQVDEKYVISYNNSHMRVDVQCGYVFGFSRHGLGNTDQVLERLVQYADGKLKVRSEYDEDNQRCEWLV